MEHFNEAVLDHRGCSEFFWLLHQTGNRQKCLMPMSCTYMPELNMSITLCVVRAYINKFPSAVLGLCFFLLREAKRSWFLMDLENRSQDLHKLWAGLDTWNTEPGLVFCNMELQWKTGPYVFALCCCDFPSFSGLILVHSRDPIYSIPSFPAPLANFLTS